MSAFREVRAFFRSVAAHAGPRAAFERSAAESLQDCVLAQASNPSGEPHDWLIAAWLVRRHREGGTGLPAELEAGVAADATFRLACLDWESASHALGIQIYLTRFPGVTGGDELIRSERDAARRLEQLDNATIEAMYRRHNPRRAERRFGQA